MIDFDIYRWIVRQYAQSGKSVQALSNCFDHVLGCYTERLKTKDPKEITAMAVVCQLIIRNYFRILFQPENEEALFEIEKFKQLQDVRKHLPNLRNGCGIEIGLDNEIDFLFYLDDSAKNAIEAGFALKRACKEYIIKEQTSTKHEVSTNTIN